MSDKKITPGSVVRLTVGGPKMVVEYVTPRELLGLSWGIAPEGDRVSCVWFDEFDVLHREDFFTSIVVLGEE